MHDNEKQALLRSLIENPTTYELQVLDNTMLPEDLKDNKTLVFEIKPPTLEVLAKCALPALKIPEEVRESNDLKWQDAIEYRKEMAEVMAILAHGRKSEHPSWYVPFFLNNLTGKELYILFSESVLKMQTDFFLNSFQIVNQNNPMMMNEINDSTLTS